MRGDVTINKSWWEHLVPIEKGVKSSNIRLCMLCFWHDAAAPYRIPGRLVSRDEPGCHEASDFHKR